MRILVTGGAGYVGSHTCKALTKAGWDPVVFDNLSAGHRWSVKWGPLLVGNLADSDAVCRAIAEHQIEAVIHFAASVFVGESMTNPQHYFRNNFVNSLNLLDGMVQAGVKFLIFSSTCATYGLPQMVPIPESHPQQPVNPYGESKRFVERAMHWYGEAYGVRWAALRYFNAAGADPDGEIGEMHDPETHLIPLVLEAALDPQRVLIHLWDRLRNSRRYRCPGLHSCDRPCRCARESVAVSPARRSQPCLQPGHRAWPFRSRGSCQSGGDHRQESADTGMCAAARRSTCLIAQNKDAAAELSWVPRYSDLDTIVSTAWRWRTDRWPAEAAEQT